MEISSPLRITSRLLPGCRIGGAEISIEYSRLLNPRCNQRYHWFIDTQDGEFEGNDLYSGAGGGCLQEGLESLLGFLGAFAEAHLYQNQTGRESENADFFPVELADWAMQNADKISMMELDLQENRKQLIVE